MQRSPLLLHSFNKQQLTGNREQGTKPVKRTGVLSLQIKGWPRYGLYFFFNARERLDYVIMGNPAISLSPFILVLDF